jgi:hypothetical protein
MQLPSENEGWLERCIFTTVSQLDIINANFSSFQDYQKIIIAMLLLEKSALLSAAIAFQSSITPDLNLDCLASLIFYTTTFLIYSHPGSIK